MRRHDKRLRRRAAGLALGLMLLALSGCGLFTRQAKPPEPTPVVLGLDYFSGTPLSGPSDTPLAKDAMSQATPVRITVVATKSFPDDLGQPLAAQAVLITATRGDSAVLASTTLTRNTRLLLADPAAKAWPKLIAGAQPIDASGVLPQGATLTANVTGPTLGADPVTGLNVRQQVAVSLYRLESSAGGQAKLRLALTLVGRTEPRPRRGPASGVASGAASGGGGDEDEPANPRAGLFQTETAVVDLSWTGAALDALIIVPFAPKGADWRALAIRVETGAHEANLAQLQTEAGQGIDRSIQEVASEPTTLPLAASERADLASTLNLLVPTTKRRAAFVFLTGRTGATLGADVALVADDPLLELLTARVRQRAFAMSGLEASSLGWLIDRTCFEAIVQRGAQGRLSPDLSVVLAEHCGQVARQQSTMEEMLASLRTRKEFETRLVAENLISLEDDSPSSRVHAYEWLKTRGLAPAGYGPLDPPQDRRQALEKAAAPHATAPTGATP